MAAESSFSISSTLAKMQPSNATMFHEDSDDSDEEEGREAMNMSTEIEDLETANEMDRTGGEAPPTDRYGFYLDAGKQAVALPPEEYHRRANREALRETKWEKMMRRWDFTINERKAKLKRRIRKGVPDKLRGEVWDVLARVPQLAQEHRSGRFADLLAEADTVDAEVAAVLAAAGAASSSSGLLAAASGASGGGGGNHKPTASVNVANFEAIEKDLGRTFPGHAMFSQRPQARTSGGGGGGGEGGGDGGRGGSGGGAGRGGQTGGGQGASPAGETGKVGGGCSDDDDDDDDGSGGKGDPRGLQRLRHVLRSYALYDKEVGYCQGMSFFVAMFLIYRPPTTPTPPLQPPLPPQQRKESEADTTEVVASSFGSIERDGGRRGFRLRTGGLSSPSKSTGGPTSTSTASSSTTSSTASSSTPSLTSTSSSRVAVVDEGEERAFWQLVGVMWRPESGIRQLFLMDMQALLEKMNTMEQLVAAHLPNIHRHLEAEGISYSMFATSWYMTLFSSAFPFDLVTRVWDAFLGEGFKVLHRVSLSLLKCFESELLSRSFEELVGFLQHDLPNAVDPDVVMDTAFKLKLTKKEVDHIEADYRAASQSGGR